MKKYKVLHIAHNIQAGPNYPMRNALKSVFAEYDEIDWIEERKKGQSYLLNLIKQTAKAKKYDICFMQIQSEGVLTNEVCKHIRNTGST